MERSVCKKKNSVENLLVIMILSKSLIEQQIRGRNSFRESLWWVWILLPISFIYQSDVHQ
jgi:hypothetical protein